MYLWQALIHFSAWMPIRILLMQERGLSFAAISVMGSVGWLVTALAEVPTGAVADTYGRKVSLWLGTLLVAAGVAGTGLSTTLLAFYLADFVWSIGLSLLSGADQALLYDSLKAAGREEEFPKAVGRMTAILQITQAAGSIVGGYLASFHLALPYFVSASAAALALGALWMVKEPPGRQAGGQRTSYSDTLKALRPVLARREILYLLLFMAVLGVTFFLVVFHLFQPYYQGRGMKVEWLGVSFAALRGVGVVGAWYAHKARERLGESLLLRAGLLIIAGALLAMAAGGLYVGLACFAVIGVTNALMRPSLSTVLNRLVPSEVRASVLSAQSLLYSLLLALAQVGVGFLVDGAGMNTTLVVMSTTFLLLTGLFLALWTRRRTQSA